MNSVYVVKRLKMGTQLRHGVGQRENGLMKCEAKYMRIEALMAAVDAAGYVMVAEDDLPEAFGTETHEHEVARSTALAVWEPVLAASHQRQQSQVANAWSWVVGRFAGGAAA